LDGLIEDAEAVELFRRCSLLVLPYKDATQSALIAAAYFFGKPVLATTTGALPEYVVEGETGWLAPANDPIGLAETLATALSDPTCLSNRGSVGREWYSEQRARETEELKRLYDYMAR
jgi:glycosyltransferase involved in cell wall biosynthesis